MKWTFDDCEFGDVVRVKCGSVYHYGIFVSKDEVIQFGYPPQYYVNEHKCEPIIVNRVSVYDFLGGGMIEKGVFERGEKHFSREEIVARASKRIGEGGYNIIHNNCEHFVYECALGVKRSLQEEQMRKMWKNRPVFDVYVAFDIDALTKGEIADAKRRNYICETQNQRAKEEKIAVWNLLAIAAQNSLAIDIDNVKFDRQKSGKWISDKFHFSLSHTDGCVAVAVSRGDCGIDIEKSSGFSQKCKDKTFEAAFAKKIGVSAIGEELLCQWTKKESVYKATGNGLFIPKDADIKKFGVKTVKIADYIVSAVSVKNENPNIYAVENGKCRIMFEGEYRCI